MDKENYPNAAQTANRTGEDEVSSDGMGEAAWMWVRLAALAD